MLPVSTITGLTATGDVVVGPGAINCICNGMPVATLASVVAGPVCVGVVTMTAALNSLRDGLPVATLTSAVTGLNPETGVPVETVVAETLGVNFLD